jgi:hypothetical protein
LKELKKEYEDMQLLVKPNKEQAKERGDKFEEWLVRLFELFDLSPRANIQN